MDRYLDTRGERAGSHSPTDPLFARRLKGQYLPFNLQAMDGLVAGWYRRAGIIPPPGSLAHALRHTYATLLVDATLDKCGMTGGFINYPQATVRTTNHSSEQSDYMVSVNFIDATNTASGRGRPPVTSTMAVGGRYS